jgi:hypothetical protein
MVVKSPGLNQKTSKQNGYGRLLTYGSLISSPPDSINSACRDMSAWCDKFPSKMPHCRGHYCEKLKSREDPTDSFCYDDHSLNEIPDTSVIPAGG